MRYASQKDFNNGSDHSRIRSRQKFVALKVVAAADDVDDDGWVSLFPSLKFSFDFSSRIYFHKTDKITV